MKNAGAYLDKEVTSVCKAAWYHLFQISEIKHFPTVDQAKSIIHAYFTSRIDQINSLLLGLPKKYIKHMQNVQNASARSFLSEKNMITSPLHCSLFIDFIVE